jgi:hypothetical protein
MQNMSRIGRFTALALGFARLVVRAGAAEGAPSELIRLEALIERQGRALDAQEARLADLERQNRDLQARLDVLMARGVPHVLGGQVTNAAAVQTAHAASPASSAAAALLTFTKPNGFSVVPYGYFKFDAVHDSARTAFGDAAVYVMPHSLSGGGEEDLSFSARESRLGFAVTAPAHPRLRVTGRLEGDFYGDLANQDSYQFRLRLAYLDAAWGEGWSLRLGQDWDAFTSFHPKMLDAGILAGTGHLWGRRPQARLTKVTPLGDATRLVLKAAVENGYKNDVDSDGQQDSNASGVPQAVAQIALETRLLTRRDTLLSLSGLYGEERTRRAPSADSYPVELIQLAARLPLANPFTLQGTLWAGQNLDAYYGGVLQGINLADGRAVSACGGWVEGVYDLSERWSAALGYGLDNPSDGDLALATSRTRNERIYASLFYLVTANLMIGGEYALLRTEFKEEERVTDNRIQFSGQLSF